MKQVLVTGGAGFIGGHLVDALIARGDRVRVLDNFLTGSRDAPGRWGDAVEFVEGDAAEPDTAGRCCEGVDAVFHVAALPSVPVSMERPLDTHRHGDVATYTMLTAAQRAGVRRFVYSSSSSVYGGEGPFPQTEQSPPVPKSPYAATKLCGEIYVRVFARAFGLDGVSLRYFNVFGPRQPARGGYAAVFPAMITRMMKGEAPVIYGDGAQTRDFTYVANVVAANLAAADAAQPLGGAALNVGAGARTSVLELAQRLNRAMGTDLAPEHIGSRPGDVKDSWADVSLAQRLIDYRPVVDIDEGLMRTVEWYCSQ